MHTYTTHNVGNGVGLKTVDLLLDILCLQALGRPLLQGIDAEDVGRGSGFGVYQDPPSTSTSKSGIWSQIMGT